MKIIGAKKGRVQIANGMMVDAVMCLRDTLLLVILMLVANDTCRVGVRRMPELGREFEHLDEYECVVWRREFWRCGWRRFLFCRRRRV